MKATDPPIVTEQLFNSNVDRVWKAITDPSEMKQWFFPKIESFRAEVGFSTEFIVQLESKTFTHLWEIVEVVQNQKIKYNWKYKEYAGDGFVVFEVFEEGNGAKLRVTAEVTETYPQEIPEFARESGVAGWKYFIQGSLKDYLNQNI